MLTNKTFDEMLNICFQEYPEDFSMTFNAMKKALNRFSLKTKRLRAMPKTITKDLLIECKHKTQHYWHYLVYDAEQKTFLDPIPNPPHIEDYEFYRIIEIQR